MTISAIQKNSFSHLRKDSLRKRLELIEYATDMFIELGFEKVSMNQLVKRSGCSKSTLYKHFASKEVLFIAVIDDALQDHMAPIDEINLTELDIEETLWRIADAGMLVITSQKHIAPVSYNLCRGRAHSVGWQTLLFARTTTWHVRNGGLLATVDRCRENKVR